MEQQQKQDTSLKNMEGIEHYKTDLAVIGNLHYDIPYSILDCLDPDINMKDYKSFILDAIRRKMITKELKLIKRLTVLAYCNGSNFNMVRTENLWPPCFSTMQDIWVESFIEENKRM
jgi:hypothetical protein